MALIILFLKENLKMGVTIHYKGKINKPDLIPKLIDDCRDFAEGIGWKCYVVDEKKGYQLKGIILSVHYQAEPLNLIFGKNGSLRSCIDYKQTQLFIKTQFSGAETHIAVVKLLKYLRKHYISNLEVFDEGEYWETGDIDRLSEKLSFLQSKIDVLKDVFRETRFTKEESQDSLKLADRVERLLRETFENKE